MNIRNLFGLKYLAMMLLAAFTFTSCEEDEFTAEDAARLEQERLQLLEQFAQDREQTRFDNEMAMRRYQNTVDSLRRINAGGRVLYTVVVVPGESSVFAGGRLEEAEGLAGTTVTVEQFGISTPVTTDESGVASFLLYSGEVTVNASTDGYTDVNYVANLTPDGGVPNSTVAHVGNVLPVFFNDATAADAADKMAMIGGRFFAETDLTNTQEEVLFSTGTSDGKTYLAGAPGVVAFIDPNDAFKNEYLRENFDEGFNIDGDRVLSGFIQRIAYEEAGGIARPNESGDYTLMVPATGSGLQMRMRYSQFAANRTFVSVSPFDFEGVDFDPNTVDAGFTLTLTEVIDALFASGGTFEATDARTIYSSDIPLSQLDNPGAGFSLFAAFTGVPGSYKLENDAVVNTVDFVQNDADITAEVLAGDAVASVSVNGTNLQPGEYLVPPTVTFGAPATGTDVATARNGQANLDYSAAVGGAGGNTLFEVSGVTISNGGSGYTSAPAVTFERRDPGFTGTGVLIGAITTSLVGSTPASIPVVQGGAGFSTVNGAVQGGWTGLAPIINIPSPANGGPTGANDIIATFYFDTGASAVGGVRSTNAATIPATLTGSFGTVSYVTLEDPTDDNDGWTAAALTALSTPQYAVEEARFPVQDIDADGDRMFITDDQGRLFFNPAFGDAPNDIAAATGITEPSQVLDLEAALNNNLDANFAQGIGYVFVPGLDIAGGTGTVTQSAVTVGDINGANAGEVQSISVTASSGFYDAAINTVNLGYASGNFFELTNAQHPNSMTAQQVATPQPNAPLVLDAASIAGGNSGGSVGTYTITGRDFSTVYADLLEDYPSTQDILTDPNENVSPANIAGSTANTFYVAFSEPADGRGDNAIGLPVFEDINGEVFGDAGNPTSFDAGDAANVRLVGIELITGGSGYDPNQEISFRLVPVGVDLEDETGSIATTAATEVIGRTALTDPRIKFTINDGGNYSVTPKLFINGEGFSYVFQEVDPIANPTDVIVNNLGEIVRIGSTTNPNSRNFNTIPMGTIAQGPDAGQNNFTAGETLDVTIDVSEREAIAEVVINGFLTNFPGNAAATDAYHFVGTGVDNPLAGEAIDGYKYIDAEFDGANNQNGAGLAGNEVWNSTAVLDYVGLFGGNFRGFEVVSNNGNPAWILPFTVTTGGLFGGSGAEALILIDDITGEYAGFDFISGGAGYTSDIENYNDEIYANGPQAFKVLGGPDGNNGAFETFTGLSYVRDIHYGTGQLVE